MNLVLLEMVLKVLSKNDGGFGLALDTSCFSFLQLFSFLQFFLIEHFFAAQFFPLLVDFFLAMIFPLVWKFRWLSSQASNPKD